MIVLLMNSIWLEAISVITFLVITVITERYESLYFAFAFAFGADPGLKAFL